MWCRLPSKPFFGTTRAGRMIPAAVSRLDVGRVEGKITPSTAYRFIREGKRFAIKRLTLILESDNSTVIGPEKHLNKIYLPVLKHSICPTYRGEEKEEIYTTMSHILGRTEV